MPIPRGALPFWEPQEREFFRLCIRNGETGKSTPRNECRFLRARFNAREFHRLIQKQANSQINSQESMSIPKGALPLLEPKARKLPGNQPRQKNKSLSRNECRPLRARFHSGSRRHGNLTILFSETERLANRFPGMNVDP